LTFKYKNIQVILLAAGSSNRFSSKKNKVLSYYKDKTLIEHNVEYIKKIGFSKISLVINGLNIRNNDAFNDLEILKGGNTRSKSVLNALTKSKYNSKYVIIHDVARPIFNSSLFIKICKNLFLEKYDALIPFARCTETITLNNKNLDRENIKIIKTPQAFNKKILFKLHMDNKNLGITDDSYLFRKNKIYKVKYIEDRNPNIKITYKEELDTLNNIANREYRVGIGYDIHRILKTNKKKLIKLGNTFIRAKIDIIAHSDGDVILHAITDSILGALSKRDMGTYFPNDKTNENRNSLDFLKFALNEMILKNFRINNIDLMIVSEEPKINPFFNKLKKSLVKILNTSNIAIKATTNEKSGLIGKSKFIACWSNVSLIKN